MLRDAVAAHTRRRFRDGALLLLLVVFAFVNLWALVLWLISAIVVSMVVGQGAARKGRTAAIFAVIVAVGILVVLWQFASAGLSGLLVNGASNPLPEGSSISYWGIILVLLILAVLDIDEFIVHRLVYTSFRSQQFVLDGRRADSGWERTVRTLGHEKFQQSLARVAAVDEQATDQNPKMADVVVHRGFSPFIGAGKPIHHKTIALPLEPAEEERKTQGRQNTRRQPYRISVSQLQQHVADVIGELRSSSSLGPGGRLAGLSRHEQVLMAADRLVTNLDGQPRPAVLPDLHHPPVAHMPTVAARDLADTPQEWARYYQCFRIEAWDRDLTTSCYLHAGTDQRMLFLEWTFCLLPPIRHSYRKIDRLEDPLLIPLVHSLMELVVLPATVTSRCRSLFRRFKPLTQRDGEAVPDKYGAGKSLRELAADTTVQNYFQDVDVERYAKILDAALFRAVGQYLEGCGYSVVEFMRLADPVVNQINNISGGTFLGSAVGFGNTTQGNINRHAT